MFADEADAGMGHGVRAGFAEALEPLSDKADGAHHACVDIAPLGGRLLAFWADEMGPAVAAFSEELGAMRVSSP